MKGPTAKVSNIMFTTDPRTTSMENTDTVPVSVMLSLPEYVEVIGPSGNFGKEQNTVTPTFLE